MTTQQYKYLFEPIKIGSETIKNRLYFGAHGTCFQSKDNILDERYIEYLRMRAKGGAGLIIAGAMNVMHSSHNSYTQEIFDEKVLPPLRHLAETMHQYGTKVFLQILHAGRQMESTDSRQPIWAPSAIPCPVIRETPKEMEVEDIREAVKAYARSAVFAKEAGLDGLQVHFGSGYLLMQFLSPLSNIRTDEYGGSIENRLRFPMEIIDAICESVGNDFVLGIRICADELLAGGNTFDDMKEIIQRIEASGKIDFIQVGGSFYQIIWGVGTGMHTPLGFCTPYAAAFKEAVNLPILNDMRINDPVQAEKILANGQCDMVGMVRPLIADPELPNKAREGRSDEIRSCLACNQGCFGRFFRSKPIACTQNAVVGKEKEIGILESAKSKKKVLIVGGGPAGMETARVARIRGHEVVLYEKEKILGGQVNIAVKAPYRAEFGGITRYLSKQMEILGVKVSLGTEVTPELIDKEKPDAVVIATGSVPSRPPIPGTDQENVLSVWDVLQEKVEAGEKVVVLDSGESHWQCLSAAEYLIDKGKKVEIITPLMFLGMDLVTTGDLVSYYIRVKSKGVVFSTCTALKEISGRTLVAFDIHTNAERRIEGVDTVVLAAFNQANNRLYSDLKGKVKDLYAVGDCLAPRKALDAIYDGYNVGRLI